MSMGYQSQANEEARQQFLEGPRPADPRAYHDPGSCARKDEETGPGQHGARLGGARGRHVCCTASAGAPRLPATSWRMAVSASC